MLSTRKHPVVHGCRGRLGYSQPVLIIPQRTMSEIARKTAPTAEIRNRDLFGKIALSLSALYLHKKNGGSGSRMPVRDGGFAAYFENFLVGAAGVISSLAIIIGVGLRLYLAYVFFGNNDQQSWEIVVQVMQQGDNLYARQAPYPYGPLWAYILYALSLAGNLAHLPLHFVVRAFLTLVDITNALLVGKIAAPTPLKFSRAHFALYLLNPVAIWIIGFHGQFDTLAMFPLLLAVTLFQRYGRTIAPVWLWLLGTLALVLKQIMLFGVLGLYLFIARDKKSAAMMMLASVAVFLLSFVPFLPEGATGVRIALLYQGTGMHGVWRVLAAGLDYMRISPLLQKGLTMLIFGGLMTGFLWLARYRWGGSLARTTGISFIGFMALAPSFSIQYLLLPVAWGSIFPSRLFLLYTLLGTVFTTLRYLDLTSSMLVIRSISAMIWVCSTVWFLNEAKTMIRHGHSATNEL